MKIGDIKNLKISKKYANALYEAAIEVGSLEKINQDIIFVVETLNSNNQLDEFLKSPLIKIQDKKDVVQKLFSVHIEKTTLDFIYVLIDSGRFDIINEVLNQFAVLYNKEKNIVKPVIISAVELDSNQKNTLLSKLEGKLNKKVEPEYIINSKIIGGLVIEIEDKTIDCSLKAKFDNMQKQLTKGTKYGND